jgi:hypothetical protein
MKKATLLIVVAILGFSVSAQEVGIKLHTLIDLGADLMYSLSFRGFELGRKNVIGIPLDGYPQVPKGLERVLFYDCDHSRVERIVEFNTKDSYGIRALKNANSFYIATKEKILRYDYGKGVYEASKEDWDQYIKENPTTWRNSKYDYTAPSGKKFSYFPYGWVDDLDADPVLLEKLGTRPNNMDWELINRTYICMTDPYAEISRATMYVPYDFRNLNDELYFRIPYVMAPAQFDDIGEVTPGNKIALSEDGKRLYVSGHSYTHFLFPELIGKEEKKLREYIWVYDIVNQEEWDALRERKANYVVLKADITGIREIRKIDPGHLSIQPGTRKVYGLYGECTEANINMRSGPSLTATVLTTLNSAANYNRRFFILDRSERKQKVGNMEDYWYKVIYQTDEEKEGWVYGAFVRFVDKLKDGIEATR